MSEDMLSWSWQVHFVLEAFERQSDDGLLKWDELMLARALWRNNALHVIEIATSCVIANWN